MPVLVLVCSVQLVGDIYPRTPKLSSVSSLEEAAELLIQAFPPARDARPSMGRLDTVVLTDEQERRVVAWVAELSSQPQTITGAPRDRLFPQAVQEAIPLWSSISPS